MKIICLIIFLGHVYASDSDLPEGDESIEETTQTAEPVALNLMPNYQSPCDSKDSKVSVCEYDSTGYFSCRGL